MKGRHVLLHIIVLTKPRRADRKAHVLTPAGTAGRKQQVDLRHLLPSLLLLRSVLARRRTPTRGHVRVLAQEAKEDVPIQVLIREEAPELVLVVLQLKAMPLLAHAEVRRISIMLVMLLKHVIPSAPTEVPATV